MKKEKELVSNIKSAVLLIHTSHHRVKGAGIFQTPFQKAVFGD
jgi:hypothetical protein